MSSRRSIKYMTPEELALKHKLDGYRHDLLNEGPIDVVKNPDRGLDDLLYVASHKLTGRAKKKQEYFQRQQDVVSQEVGSSLPNDITPVYPESMKEEYAQVLRVPNNPQTLYTLKQKRQELRAQRIEEMREEDEVLHVGELLTHYKTKISDSVSAFGSGIANTFGSAGSALVSNPKITIAALGLAWSGFVAGPKWYKSHKEHTVAVNEYVDSAAFGRNSIEIKREVPKLIGRADTELYQRDEIIIESTDEDGNTTETVIPEDTSNPQYARRIIHMTIDKFVAYTSAEDLERFDISQRSQDIILRESNAAQDYLQSASKRLEFARDIHRHYVTEQAIIGRVIPKTENISDEFELHMDPNVVEKEDSTHAKMQLWKALTLWPLCGVGALFGVGTYTRVRKSRQSRFY